mmetsp:Transcript_655/g.2190  ORF Transcript_655/g.2190 Transcript_655/m.2190 type:complete len:175 (-) Transcript_655:123-647(-)
MAFFGDSRTERLQLVLQKAVDSILEECSPSAFLSHFPQCATEEERAKLLNLRELFVQLFRSSVEHEYRLLCDELGLESRMAILDAASRGHSVCGLQPAKPNVIVSDVRTRLKSVARDQLRTALKSHEEQLQSERLKLDGVQEQIRSSCHMIEEAEKFYGTSDAAVDGLVHHSSQ